MTFFQDIMRYFSTDPKWYEIPSAKIRVKFDDVSLDDKGNVLYEGLKPGTCITTIQDTGSMEPMLDIGMQIILEPVTDIHDLIIGDVIVYQKGDGTTIHRIKKITEDAKSWKCVCRGDRNAYDDPAVDSSQVKWVLRGIIF
jgi:signal peptidase I